MASNGNSPAERQEKIQEKGNNKKEDLLLDLTKRLYDSEWERTAELDGKAGNLIGYITIVTGLLIGLGTFSILEKLSLVQFYIPYFIGIAFLLLSIITSLLATKVRTFYSSPTDTELEAYYKDNEMYYKRIAKQVIFNMILSTQQNFKSNNIKAKRILASWIFLVVGISFIVVYSGIVVASGETNNNEIKIILNGNSSAIKDIIKEAVTNITNIK